MNEQTFEIAGDLLSVGSTAFTGDAKKQFTADHTLVRLLNDRFQSMMQSEW